LRFYRILKTATFGQLGISLKTRLADILRCPDSLWNTFHGRRIAQKHVDFVLFDPETTAILAVIELDDRSHALQERQRRDLFLNQALLSAGIPLLRVRAAAWYDLTDLREEVEKTLLTRRTSVAPTSHRRRIPHNRG
jgi:very-short-patch-repair endonuclease